MSDISTFNKTRTYYDSYAVPQRWAAETLLAFMPDTCSSICELGCGTGLLTQRLLSKYPKTPILAVDRASALFQTLGEKLQGSPIAWEHLDLNKNIPKTDADLIVSSAALHWLDDLEKLFSDLLKHHTKKTHLVFNIMLKGTLKEVRECRSVCCPDVPPFREMPEWEDVLQKLENAGWKTDMHVVDEFVLPFQTGSDLLRSLQRTGVNGFPYGRGIRPLNRSELKNISSCLNERNDSELPGIPCTYRCGFIAAHAN